MFMGAGIRGNQVIGATDDGVHALPVNLETLELDEWFKDHSCTPSC